MWGLWLTRRVIHQIHTASYPQPLGVGKFLRHFWGIFIDNNSYDDGKLITRLWDDYTVKPVIDIRNMWKDGEPTRLVNGMGEVLYDYCGNVYCYLEPDKKGRWRMEVSSRIEEH